MYTNPQLPKQLEQKCEKCNNFVFCLFQCYYSGLKGHAIAAIYVYQWLGDLANWLILQKHHVPFKGSSATRQTDVHSELQLDQQLPPVSPLSDKTLHVFFRTSQFNQHWCSVSNDPLPHSQQAIQHLTQLKCSRRPVTAHAHTCAHFCSACSKHCFKFIISSLLKWCSNPQTAFIHQGSPQRVALHVWFDSCFYAGCPSWHDPKGIIISPRNEAGNYGAPQCDNNNNKQFPKRSETFRESYLFHKYLTELNSVCHVQNSKMKKVISSGTKRNVGLLDKAALLSDPPVTQLCKHKLIYKVS